jgi:hypothetical protein
VNVTESVRAWVGVAGELSEHGRVLVASAMVLAAEIDAPPLQADGSPKSVAGSVSALQRVMAELERSGRRAADGGADWAISAVNAGATPIRDTAQPVAADVRPRGRRGRPSAR